MRHLTLFRNKIQFADGSTFGRNNGTLCTCPTMLNRFAECFLAGMKFTQEEVFSLAVNH